MKKILYTGGMTQLLLRAIIVTLITFGFNSNTWAIAIYSADLQFSLTMPGAKTNLFGFGGPTSTFRTQEIENGSGIAVPTLGISTRFQVPIVPPPPDGQDIRVGRAVDNVDVFGITGPGDGFSFAESQGALFARLGNLSGSGDSTPPAQVFDAVFDLSYEYNLDTFITDPLLDDAQAQVGLFVRAKPEFGGNWVTYFNEFDIIFGTDMANDAGNVEFTIPLLPNSITLFEAQFFVNGQAITVADPPLPPIPPIVPPDPIPEPSTLFLLGSGLAGIIGFGKKKLFKKE